MSRAKGSPDGDKCESRNLVRSCLTRTSTTVSTSLLRCLFSRSRQGTKMAVGVSHSGGSLNFIVALCNNIVLPKLGKELTVAKRGWIKGFQQNARKSLVDQKTPNQIMRSKPFYDGFMGIVLEPRLSNPVWQPPKREGRDHNNNNNNNNNKTKRPRSGDVLPRSGAERRRRTSTARNNREDPHGGFLNGAAPKDVCVEVVASS